MQGEAAVLVALARAGADIYLSAAMPAAVFVIGPTSSQSQMPLIEAWGSMIVPSAAWRRRECD